jgi:uncharacterized protein YhdP
MSVLRFALRIFRFEGITRHMPNNAPAMRRMRKWILGLTAAIVALMAALVLSRDMVLRALIEHQVQRQTGLKVSIQKVSTGLMTPTLRFQGVRLNNPPELGGGLLLSAPQMDADYDPRGALSGRLLVRTLRVRVAELNLVRNASGKTIAEILLERLEGKATQRAPRKPKPSSARFEGIDRLLLSLETINYIDQSQPRGNWRRVLNWRNREQGNLKTSEDALNWLAQTYLDVIQIPPTRLAMPEPSAPQPAAKQKEPSPSPGA